MSISPTTTVQVEDFNGAPQQVPLVTLTCWAVALRAEVKGVQVSPTLVEPIVRKFLGAPDDYDLAYISKYITACHEDVKDQLGIADSSLLKGELIGQVIAPPPPPED